MRVTIATQDGFVKAHCSFSPTPSLVFNSLANKKGIKLTTEETNQLFNKLIVETVCNKISTEPDKFMKLCTKIGGSFQCTIPIITNPVTCQFDVQDAYRSTDNEVPAYKRFANKHKGTLPNFMAWTMPSYR